MPYNPWTEAAADEVAKYRLPSGVTVTCEVVTDKNIIIGTTSGVYLVGKPSRFYQSDIEEADLVGLEGFEISDLESQGEKIVAWTTVGQIFTAFEYTLSGRR